MGKELPSAGYADKVRANGALQQWALTLAVIALIASLAVVTKVVRTGREVKTAPPPDREQKTSPATPRVAGEQPVPLETRAKMNGRWLRTDGQYTLTISGTSDGDLRVTYENPGPINVARADVAQRGSTPSLYVELRDRGYPGNYYELAFDEKSDMFIGKYHHVGVQQVLEVTFARVK